MSQTRVTRFAVDLVDAATAEGARQSRSATQQPDHWARVGRAVCSAQSAATSRVQAALSGRLSLKELSADERTVVHTEVSARVEERLNETDHGAELAAEGVTTVALDDAGRLVEHLPDGTTRILGAG